MKKYIDADLLKAEFTGNLACEYPAPLVKALIDNQPAADVAEVVHGKWIDVPLNCDPNYFAYKYNLRTKCSVCDFVMPREYPRYNICPNCGAKMDKE